MARQARELGHQEDKLREVHKFKELLDRNSQFIITDTGGTMTYVNEQFCALSQYSPAELLGQNASFVSAHFHPVTFWQELWQTITQGQVWQGDVKNQAKDGTYFWVDMVVTPLLDSAGKPCQYVAIRRDITRQKKAEDSLRDTLYELKQRNEELDQYVYKVSHDLRAPLASILGLINVFRLENDPSTAGYYVGLIENRAQKLDHFIQSVLAHSQLLNVPVQATAIDLQQLIRECFEELSFYGNGNKLRLLVDSVVEEPFYGDVLRIKVIFRNLISNAIQYLNPYVDSFLKCSLTINPAQALITIEDNGIGIDQTLLPRIFEMFYKASDTSAGSGLGLYIVRQAVEKLGGELKVESQKGRGTTFFLTLPNQKPY